MKTLIIFYTIACIFSGCKKEYSCSCDNGKVFDLGKTTKSEAGDECMAIGARDSSLCAVPI